MTTKKDISPGWLRARIEGLHALKDELFIRLNEQPNNKIRQHELRLVRNGLFPMRINQEEWTLKFHDKLDYTPLSFAELCSFSTYFELHPKKVCGNEEFTSSRDFPVKIKGARKDVEQAIQNSIHSISTEDYLALERLLKQL